MDEPSVLDVFKSKLAFWRGARVSQEPVLQEEAADSTQPRTIWTSWPWRSLLGLFLALLAQRSLEPQATRSGLFAGLIFTGAIGLTAWAAWRGEWRAADPPSRQFHEEPRAVRGLALIFGIAFALLVFITSTNNLFTLLNSTLLLSALGCLVYAFWISERREQPVGWRETRKKIIGYFQSPRGIAWSLLFLGIIGIASYFRFAQLDQIPGEMNSDHAEKILDVLRVLLGQTSIFFPNNGGREALQMYLTAGLVKIFNLPLDFMALKTVSSLVGFLTLPVIYLLGKEIANRRVGLLAMAFAGVAYWPNVVSRLGLRLPFYFFFTALVLYFLVRGLRSGKRNDFILLGLALGLSLYGYSADRALLLIVLLAAGLYMLHTNQARERKQIFWYVLIAFAIAGVIFLPMLHYMIEQPEAFFYRILTRISGIEQPLPAPVALVFLRNTGRALSMFSWSNGEIWTISVPNRPALDVVTGGLFWTGVVLLVVGYIRLRNWLYLFLLLSIPVLMLPSILALAFPSENPNLYRTGGAVIPVFLIVGFSLDGLMSAIQARFGVSGLRWSWALVEILFVFSAYQSYDLVFNQYRQQYNLSTWNTSEMGKVVRDFIDVNPPAELSLAEPGSGDINAWVMGYPYWVDARLIGIIAGYPLRNFALFPADVANLRDDMRAKLFIINPQDQEAVLALQQRFSRGVLSSYPAEISGKEFLIFFVPAVRE